MAKTRKFTVPLITATGGGVTAYTPYLDGFLESLQYIKTDFSDGVDFTITADVTGEAILTEENINASAIRRPRAPTHTTAGVAATYDDDAKPVLDRIALSRDRVKIVIVDGGNTKTGTVVVTMADR